MSETNTCEKKISNHSQFVRLFGHFSMRMGLPTFRRQEKTRGTRHVILLNVQCPPFIRVIHQHPKDISKIRLNTRVTVCCRTWTLDCMNHAKVTVSELLLTILLFSHGSNHRLVSLSDRLIHGCTSTSKKKAFAP